MRQGLCNGLVSVICVSKLLSTALACGWFAAEGPAGRRYRSIAARLVECHCYFCKGIMLSPFSPEEYSTELAVYGCIGVECGYEMLMEGVVTDQ